MQKFINQGGFRPTADCVGLRFVSLLVLWEINQSS
jgi:hypothetical protein